MARIRSIKPDVFRHELLQDLEETHAHLRPMLTFIGLWPQADRLGQFEWKPRRLHLDILPFVDYDLRAALELLESNGFLERYEVGGKVYGRIPTWKVHQRITGDEALRPARYPSPIGAKQQDDSVLIHDETIPTPTPKGKPGRKPREKKEPPSLKLPPHLEPWFEAIWFDVWPEQVVKDGSLVPVDRGRKAVARERFQGHARAYLPVALYLSTRAYVKNDPKVKDGYVQTVATFFGPGKSTFKDYLEEILPWLEDHPSVKAMAEPPESEEAFQELCRKDLK
ncbi:MAG TPA: hypothetical protein PKO12_10810 [Holophaga sp.]|nr:hypothetical protein [Holophaga sp.]